jgi:hypothetical protein
MFLLRHPGGSAPGQIPVRISSDERPNSVRISSDGRPKSAPPGQNSRPSETLEFPGNSETSSLETASSSKESANHRFPSPHACDRRRRGQGEPFGASAATSPALPSVARHWGCLSRGGQQSCQGVAADVHMGVLARIWLCGKEPGARCGEVAQRQSRRHPGMDRRGCGALLSGTRGRASHAPNVGFV